MECTGITRIVWRGDGMCSSGGATTPPENVVKDRVISVACAGRRPSGVGLVAGTRRGVPGGFAIHSEV